jgi:hypothetical protein
MSDLFAPEKESPADKAWRLELTTIARLLSTRPNSRRATKIDNPFPLYRIDDRKTDRALALVLFQNIARDYQPGKPAPCRMSELRETVKLADLEGLAPFYLCHWANNHWGFARLPGFFEIDAKITGAGDSPNIALIPPDLFVAIYTYQGRESSKIQ